MKGEEFYLSNLLEGKKTRFIIPVYQRNYDWKIEQCKRLFEDLEDVIVKEQETHFFGSIVSKAERDVRVVIDGQQRITTTFLLLLALVHQVRKDNSVAQDENLIDMITDEYLVDKYHKDECKLKLKLVKDDQLAFEAVYAEDEEKLVKDSNITQNYLYFCECIAKSGLSADEIHKAIGNLMVIDIKLDREDDAQLIFESLNSTGLDLSEGDKIRNFILMGLETDLQEKYYSEYWNVIERNTSYDVSSFIRDWLAAKRKQTPALKKVYAVFREYVKSNSIQTDDLLVELLRYSNHYRAIREADTNNENIDAVLRRLFLLEMSVLNPFLLNLLEYRSEDCIEDKELVEVLKNAETYIFRRWSCKIPTNGLNKVFETLHGEVLRGREESASYVSVFNYILLSKDGSGRFPHNDEFLESLNDRNFYHIQNKKFYLYDRLENGDSRERVNIVEGLSDERYTVEHIMPQTLSKSWIDDLGENHQEIHDNWLNSLANLTLTGYNSQYSNKRFTDKRDTNDGFIDSGLRINRFIASCDRWGVLELQERNEILKSKFLELWPLPKTEFVPKVEIHEEHGLGEDFDFTNKKVAAYTFMGSRFTVKTWVEAICGVLSHVHELDSVVLHRYVPEGEFPSRYFSEEETEYCFKVANGIYFNPGSSTETKIYILKKIFERAGINESDLSFELYHAGGFDGQTQRVSNLEK